MPVEWPRSPIQIIQAFEARRPGRGETGALVLWATWTVEGLYYLDDLDGLHRRGCLTVPDHPAGVVDIAHVRWATTSAITALDLCAAALGREWCGHTGRHELHLRHFDPSGKDQAAITSRRDALSATLVKWVDDVLADPRYSVVHGARNPLTHSRLIRRLSIGGVNNTAYFIPPAGDAVNGRDIISRARNLAMDQVSAFLSVIDTLPYGD